MSDRLRAPVFVLVGLLALMVGLAVALPFGRVGLLAVVGFAGALVLLGVPNKYLPSVALVALVIVPRQLYAETLLNNFSVALFVVLLWRIRLLAVKAGPRSRSLQFINVLAVILCAWMLWVSVLAGSAPFRYTYVIAFALSLGVFLTARASQADVARLLSTWQILAVILTVYALVEFVLQRNPIFDPLIALSGSEPVQHWSVYRAYATLGHPLYAGLFFSIAFAISVGRKLEGGANRNLLFAGAALVGVLLTVSRNSLGAAAVAAALLVGVSMFSPRSKVPVLARLGLGVLLLGGLVLAFQSSVFQERVDSAEAGSSTAARDALLDLALRAARAHDWLGAGAASAAQAAAPFNANEIYIEGAWYQILISLGVPGILLFLLLFACSFIFALRRGRYAAAGAVIAYAFSISFTPVLESHRPYLLLLGFVVWSCWAPSSEVPVEPVAVDGRASATSRRELRSRSYR